MDFVIFVFRGLWVWSTHKLFFLDIIRHFLFLSRVASLALNLRKQQGPSKWILLQKSNLVLVNLCLSIRLSGCASFFYIFLANVSIYFTSSIIFNSFISKSKLLAQLLSCSFFPSSKFNESTANSYSHILLLVFYAHLTYL